MAWDWSLVTAISSLVGVIGGLMSVIFLIYEVRHNTRAIEGATVQALMSLEQQVFGMVADKAELYLQASHDLDSLSPADQLRYNRIVGAQMSLYYSAWVQLQEGLMDAEVWDAYMAAIRQTLDTPGAAKAWAQMETRYPRSFRERIAL